MAFRSALVLLNGLLCFRLLAAGAPGPISDDAPLVLPTAGAYELRILDPMTLELFLVTEKKPEPAKLETWNFSNNKGQLALPSAAEFQVEAAGQKIAVQSVGFKRRALYAPLKQRDLRVAN